MRKILLNAHKDNSNERHIKDSVENKFWRCHLHLSDGENIQPDSSQDCNNTACRNRQVQRPWREEYTDGRQDATLKHHGAGYVSYSHSVFSLSYPEDAVDLLRELCGDRHNKEGKGYYRDLQQICQGFNPAHKSLCPGNYEGQRNK